MVGYEVLELIDRLNREFSPFGISVGKMRKSGDEFPLFWLTYKFRSRSTGSNNNVLSDFIPQNALHGKCEDAVRRIKREEG